MVTKQCSNWVDGAIETKVRGQLGEQPYCMCCPGPPAAFHNKDCESAAWSRQFNERCAEMAQLLVAMISKVE
jgi:hypothetical protein